MSKQIERLEKAVNEFLANDIGASEFEERFTEIYDFEELELDEPKYNYFQQVRQILERYSFSQNDIQTAPTYFINDKQLKERVVAITKDNN